MKNKNFAFRINENDLNKIKSKAKKAHLTTTEYLTRQALDKPIVVIDGLSQLTTELKAIGRNLNQLTTLANMGKISSINLENMILELSLVHSKINNISEVII
ncbi:MAG: plasmid mobilization relaxosome protein MobC [Clostridia bacterium]